MGYKFFENENCEYYPCHKAERLNCLFCFCPLYGMSDCGGNFRMVETEKGKVKDCSDCCIPHGEDGYDYVTEKLKKREEN